MIAFETDFVSSLFCCHFISIDGAYFPVNVVVPHSFLEMVDKYSYLCSLWCHVTQGFVYLHKRVVRAVKWCLIFALLILSESKGFSVARSIFLENKYSSDPCFIFFFLNFWSWLTAFLSLVPPWTSIKHGSKHRKNPSSFFTEGLYQQATLEGVTHDISPDYDKWIYWNKLLCLRMVGLWKWW